MGKGAGAIELLVSVASVLFSVVAAFMGLVTLVLFMLLLPPIHVRARVDSLRFDEDAPQSWEELSFHAQVKGLLGAVELGVEQRAGATASKLRLFGFVKPLRPAQGDPRATLRDGAAQEPAWQRKSSSTKPLGHSPPASSHRWRRPKASKGKRPKRPRIPVSQLRGLVPDFIWLLKEAWRQFNLSVRGRLVYGLSDPFATAIAQAVIASLPPMPELKLQPDYLRGVLEGWIEFGLKVHPWQAVVLGVRLVFRPGVRSLWWPRIKGALRIIPKSTKEVVNT